MVTSRRAMLRQRQRSNPVHGSAGSGIRGTLVEKK